MMHMNIRSIPQNSLAFECFLESLNCQFNIIGLSETWFNEANHDLYNLDGYNCVSNYRSHQSGGGVSLLLNKDLTFVLRQDLTMMNASFESIFIETTNVFTSVNSKQNIVIGVIYRPPNTDSEIFHELLTNTLSIINRENKTSFIMGDFNYDLLLHNSNGATSDFLDLMFSHSRVPLRSPGPHEWMIDTRQPL